MTPLPSSIANIIGQSPRTKVTNSWSGAVVERVQMSPAMYLKSCTDSNGSVRREADRLKWLAETTGGDWFPRVINAVNEEGMQYMLTAAMPGDDLYAWASKFGIEPAVQILSDVLNTVARIPIIHCPFVMPTSTLLKWARQSIEEGIPENWIEENAPGATADDLLRLATQCCPLEPSEKRFIHGDVYPNNILVDEQGKWALVDWPWAGVGDFHRDVSKAFETIRNDWGDPAIKRLRSQLEFSVDEKTLKGFIALHPLL